MSVDITDQPDEIQRYRFDQFVLDVRDRQLWRGDVRVDVNARYLDALTLLIRSRGQLVPKEKFFEEVWGDVVVSDSALTQCIKEIRKVLGDDASNPRYIQTIPRHGYRFVADAIPDSSEPVRSGLAKIMEVGARHSGALHGDRVETPFWKDALLEWGVGTTGGGVAGLFGGLIYGFGLASADAGVGTFSTMLVLISLNVLVGVTGGFGVSSGLAGAGIAAHFVPQYRLALRIAGAAFGGLFVGTLVKLLGVDAFNLLFGRAPAGITGGKEGAVIGASVALGAYLGNRVGQRSGSSQFWHAPVGAGVIAAIAGILISLGGGRLMGGSLALVADSFVDSRLQLDQIGALFGELEFGRATQVILGGIETFLFGIFVIGALALMIRTRRGRADAWRL